MQKISNSVVPEFVLDQCSETRTIFTSQTTDVRFSFYSQLNYDQSFGKSGDWAKLSALRNWANSVNIPTSDSNPNHPDVIALISR